MLFQQKPPLDLDAATQDTSLWLMLMQAHPKDQINIAKQLKS
jgi:hypothetical protein